MCPQDNAALTDSVESMKEKNATQGKKFDAEVKKRERNNKELKELNLVLANRQACRSPYPYPTPTPTPTPTLSLGLTPPHPIPRPAPQARPGPP